MRLNAEDVEQALLIAIERSGRLAALSQDCADRWWIDGPISLDHLAEALCERLEDLAAGTAPATARPPDEGARTGGRCRICGCTELAACTIVSDAAEYDERPCAWADAEHTLCDSPTCLEAVRILEAEAVA